MSCVLSIYGRKLDIDALISNCKLEPYQKYYKGRSTSESEASRLPYSYFTLLVSKGGFNELDKQINDAILFLKKNKRKLLQISLTKEVDEAGLIFSIKSTVYDNHNFVQSSYFPKDLLKIVSDLGIGIQLSVYSKQ